MPSQVHRGISLIVPPLPSERTGRGFCRASVQAFEILLQTVRCYCLQINPLSLKTAFVTFRESVSYKQACKRCPFALQNMPFYTSKDALLHCKRASFRTQKGVDGKAGRKEIDKEEPPQAPPKGGDVRGNGRIWVAEQVSNTASLSPKSSLPKPLQRRGCAWRDMECWVLGR